MSYFTEPFSRKDLPCWQHFVRTGFTFLILCIRLLKDVKANDGTLFNVIISNNQSLSYINLHLVEYFIVCHYLHKNVVIDCRGTGVVVSPVPLSCFLAPSCNTLLFAFNKRHWSQYNSFSYRFHAHMFLPTLKTYPIIRILVTDCHSQPNRLTTLLLAWEQEADSEAWKRVSLSLQLKNLAKRD